jgi:hypothetical protein
MFVYKRRPAKAGEWLAKILFYSFPSRNNSGVELNLRDMGLLDFSGVP